MQTWSIAPRIFAVIFFSLFGLLARAELDASRITDATSAEDARKTMEYIKAELPSGDGIAGFNNLYLATTANMERAVADRRFEDNPFMDRFIAEFANFYFAALRAHLEGRGHTPLAWQEVFNRGKYGSKYQNIQFAFTGMSAHIGRDLPVALKMLFAGRDFFPSHDSPEYRDYLKVNRILSETFDQVEDELFKDLRPTNCEKLLRGTAELTALPSIKAMRFKAWLDGKNLFRLSDHPLLSWNYLTGLDVGVAGANRAVFALKRRK